MPKVTKREVNAAGQSYLNAVAAYGEAAAQMHLTRYLELSQAWERQTGKRWGANPTLHVLGNPPGRRAARAVPIGKEVDRIFYVHVSEGPRVHKFNRGVRVEGLPDGSLRIYSPRGVRLWADL